MHCEFYSNSALHPENFHGMIFIRVNENVTTITIYVRKKKGRINHFKDAEDFLFCSLGFGEINQSKLYFWRFSPLL